MNGARNSFQRGIKARIGWPTANWCGGRNRTSSAALGKWSVVALVLALEWGSKTTRSPQQRTSGRCVRNDVVGGRIERDVARGKAQQSGLG